MFNQMSEIEIDCLIHHRVLNVDEPFPPEYTRGGRPLDKLKDHYENFCITRYKDKYVVSIYGSDRHANVGMAETEALAFCEAALKHAGVIE